MRCVGDEARNRSNRPRLLPAAVWILSRSRVCVALLDGVAAANAKSAPFYGSQIVRGENNRWILQPMEKPETKKKKKKEAAIDPSLLIATDQVPTAGYTYV